MRRRFIISFVAMLGALVTIAFGCAAFADDVIDATEPKPADEATPGLLFGLEYNSLYNFRGINVFQSTSQHDQHMILSPYVTYHLFDTGVYVNYWGAFQLNGSNRSVLIDSGYGAEQDFVVGFDYEIIPEELTFNSAVVNYVYPFVEESAAGTSCPYYVEPLVGVTWNTVVDAALSISYYYGVQSAIKDYRYAYFNPRVGKSFELTDFAGVSVLGSFGYKLFNDRDKMQNNVYDGRIDVEFPLHVVKHLDVIPTLHYGWTNIKGKGFSDESMLYAGLKLAATF